MAAGAYQLIAQTDFSGGMYRAGDPERMPANSFYDGENVLLDRLGSPYARGGAAFFDAEAFDAAGLTFIWDGVLSAGHTTVVASPDQYAKLATGKYTGLGHAGLKAPARAAAYAGLLYLPEGVTYDGTTIGTAAKVTPYYAVVANRLIAAGAHTVFFSNVGKPETFSAGDFHEIPGGAEILGVEGSRDACLVFTTRGIWIISNMALNLTDSTGNVQHRLDHYSNDIVLWGNAGVATWEGGLVVPGTDAVWLVRRGVTSEIPQAFTRLSNPIVQLYQAYVKAGYTPGQATVYRNHYFLPIFSSGRIVDLLVARLDLPDRQGNVPWTRLSGEGAEVSTVALRQLPGAAAVLLGGEYTPQRVAPSSWSVGVWGAFDWNSTVSGRVLALSYLDPGTESSTDQQGNAYKWSLETRSIATAGLRLNVCAGARVRYTLTGPPSTRPQRFSRIGFIGNPDTAFPVLNAEFASDTKPAGDPSWGPGTAWGAFTWAAPEAEGYEPLGNPAPPSLDAATAHRWRFARKRRFVRMRFTCEEPTSQLSLRSLELFIRQDARL